MKKIVAVGVVNLVTFCRLLLLGVLAADMMGASDPLREGSEWLVLALTDLLDGYLARRWGATTKTGAFFDATIDRLVNFTIWPLLVKTRGVPVGVALLPVGFYVLGGFQATFYRRQTGGWPEVRFWGKWALTYWWAAAGCYTAGVVTLGHLTTIASAVLTCITVRDYVTVYGLRWR